MAPNGGTFKIINKRPKNCKAGFENQFVTFQREDGIEYLCCLHHGYDSEELIGIKMDKFE